MNEETKELYLTYLSKKAESLVELFEEHYPEVKNADSYDPDHGIDVEAYYLFAKRWSERDLEGLKDLYRSGDIEEVVLMFPYIFEKTLKEKVNADEKLKVKNNNTFTS